MFIYIYMQIPVKIVLIIRHEDGNHVHLDPWPCHHVVSLKVKLGKAAPELVAAQLTSNMIFSYSPSVYNNNFFLNNTELTLLGFQKKTPEKS